MRRTGKDQGGLWIEFLGREMGRRICAILVVAGT